MRTLFDVHSSYAEVVVRSSATAALLTLPLLGAGALLPFLASPMARHAWITGALFVLLATGGLALARPRRLRIPLEPKAKLRVETTDEVEHPCYRVVVAGSEGATTLLERTSFAHLVGELSHLVERADVSIELAGEMVTEYFVVQSRGTVESMRSLEVESQWSEGYRRVVTAVWGSSTFVCLVMTWSLATAESPISGLSFGLALAAIAIAVLLGAALSTRRTRVVLSNDGLRVFETTFSVARPVLVIPRGELCGACLLDGSVTGGTTAHVILATTRGPRSTLLDSASALVVASAVGPLRQGSGAHPNGGLGGADAHPVGSGSAVENSGILGPRSNNSARNLDDRRDSSSAEPAKMARASRP